MASPVTVVSPSSAATASPPAGAAAAAATKLSPVARLSVKSTVEHLVVTLTGKDCDGALSSVVSAVAEAQATLIDVRQTVVHERLTLVLEIELCTSNSVASSRLYPSLITAARSLDLAIDFDLITEASPVRDSAPVSYVVTLLSAVSVKPTFLALLGAALAKRSFSTEKISRLSADGLRSLELVVSAGGRITPTMVGEVRAELYALGRGAGVDVAFQAESVLRRSKRLVVMDMDSTLIQQEVIDELARHAGVYEQVKEITHQAMGGKLDFNQSLRQRVGLLKGTPVSVFEQVIANLQYTAGAKDLCRTLKKLGYRLAVISGGFTRVTAHVRNELELDYHYANVLEEEDGVLTGRTVGAVVNGQRKADLLVTIAQQERITLDQVIAIGDGANDLAMLGTAGLGVAFNAKPAVQEAAKFRINQPSLMAVLYLLGLSEQDQRELIGGEEGSAAGKRGRIPRGKAVAQAK